MTDININYQKIWLEHAEHWYAEFERVEKGVIDLRNGDIDLYGKLSCESRNSSIYNYKTGSDELKELY